MAPLASTDRIVSRRLEQSDAHTIAGYEGTGGYDGLKAALTGTKPADQARKDAQREADRILKPFK